MATKILNKYNGMSIQLKTVFWFTIVGFLQKGISVITTPVFTRILDTEQYGMFSVYSAWSEVLLIIVTLYLHMAVINNAFMKTGQSKELVVSSFQGLSLVTSVIALIVYLLFNDYIVKIIGLPSVIVTCMFISFIFIPPFQYWIMYKRYQYDYKKMAAASIAIAVATPLCSMVLIFLTDEYKGEARIIGKILVLCIVGIVFMIINWRKDKTFYNGELWKYALVFNIPLIPHFLSETILNQSDRIMINMYCGSSDAGIYNLSYTTASLAMIFSSAINAALVPWQYQKLKDEKYKDLAKPTYLILICLGLVSSLMIMFAPEIIMILAGKEYSAAVTLIPTLAGSVFFNYLYQTLARVEMYYGKRIYTVIGTLVASAVNIILNIIFIPKFGFIAAGYTTLAAHILLCVMHYIMYRKVCKDYINNTKIYSLKLLLLISAAVLLIAFLMTLLYSNMILRITIILFLFAVFIIKRKNIVDYWTKLKKS